MSPDALLAKLSGDPRPQLLDVRTLVEWRVSRIEGAISAPITSLPARLAGLDLDPDGLVVAVCLSAHRSIPAVRLLREAGFADACQLQGGMRAWWKAGLPTVGGLPY